MKKYRNDGQIYTHVRIPYFKRYVRNFQNEIAHVYIQLLNIILIRPFYLKLFALLVHQAEIHDSSSTENHDVCLDIL